MHQCPATSASRPHERHKAVAQQIHLAFSDQRERSGDELRHLGVARPEKALRDPLVTAYLGQLGLRVRLPADDRSGLYVAESLDAIEPVALGSGGNHPVPSGPSQLETELDEDLWPAEVRRMVEDLLRLREPVLINGPTGCGKSMLARHSCADVAGPGPVHVTSLCGESSVDELFGTRELDGARTVFRPAPTLFAMRQRRPVILEEIDAVAPEVLFALHQIAAKEPVTLTMLQDSRGAPLTLHPWRGTSPDEPSNFLLCATANTDGRGNATGHYGGVRRLNEAFLNRWQMVKLDYPEPDAEERMLVRRVGVGRREAGIIVQVAALARAGAGAADDPRTPISIRATLRWARYLVKLERSLDAAFGLAVIDNAPEEDRGFLSETFQRVVGRAPKLE